MECIVSNDQTPIEPAERATQLRVTAIGCLSDRLLEVDDLNKLILNTAERRLSENGLKVDPWAGWLVRGIGDNDVGVTWEVHVVVQNQQREVVLVDVPWAEMSLYSNWQEVVSEAEDIGGRP